jgi:hypothetical protein
LPRVQPGNTTRCHTTELRPPAARRRRDHAYICMPLVRPILREIVARYCASTRVVFQCRLCCCCGCWSNDRAPLDTTQVGRDGGNTSALPSIDWVGRGLAGHRLSSSQVIPEGPMSFHHCTTPSALAAIPKYLVRWPAVLADIVFEVSLLQFWSPALECPVDMQVRLVVRLTSK